MLKGCTLNNMKIKKKDISIKDEQDDVLTPFLIALPIQPILVNPLDPLVAPINPFITCLIPLIAPLDPLNPFIIPINPFTPLDTLPRLLTLPFWYFLKL
jgi:hypothetical protein